MRGLAPVRGHASCKPPALQPGPVILHSQEPRPEPLCNKRNNSHDSNNSSNSNNGQQYY